MSRYKAREALGRSKSGFSTKIYLRCEGNGLSLTFLLTVGERHEAIVFESIMQQGSVKRAGCGLRRLRPLRVVGDKGYSSGKFAFIYGDGAFISPFPVNLMNGDEVRHDKSVYRQRNRIERCFNRLKQFRRLATRYEKNAQNYLAMLTLASILLWL